MTKKPIPTVRTAEELARLAKDTPIETSVDFKVVGTAFTLQITEGNWCVINKKNGDMVATLGLGYFMRSKNIPKDAPAARVYEYICGEALR